MAKSNEELTGLEWEAEKAYIVATSPRNTTPSENTDVEDDFSFQIMVEPQQQTDQQSALDINKQIETKPLEVEGSEEMMNGSTRLMTEDVDVDSLKMEGNNGPIGLVRGSSTNIEVEDSETTQSTIVTILSLDGSSDYTPQQPKESEEEKGWMIDQTNNSVKPGSTKEEPSVGASLTNSLSDHTASLVIDSARKSIMQSDSRVLVVYGPSGFGKSVLVQKLVYRSPQQFSLAVSHTTRPQKLHEMYARDFYFISKPDMVKKIKDDAFMEYVQIDQAVPIHAGQDYHRQKSLPRTSVVSISPTAGDLYGTTWEAFQEALLSNKPCAVLNISTKGAEQIKSLGISAVYILLHPGKTPEACGTIKPNYQISIDNKEEAFGLLESYALSVARKGTMTSTNEIDMTVEEWERVPNISLGNTPSQSKKKRLSHKATSFCELLNHFQNSPKVKEQLVNIKPETQSVSKMFGPPRINKRLRQERDLIFAIALSKFDDCNLLHTRSLSTIYRRLTGRGAGSTCMRFGTHWEEIGFQGSDPVDDLRGVGMLGIVQLVWLLETSLVQQIAMDVFQYSREHNQEIPFSILTLNITGLALQALREGHLSKECNRRDQVFAVLNDFMASVLLSFFHTWQRQKRSPMEVGMVLQQVGAFAKKHPRFFIHELKTYLTKLDKKEIQLDLTPVSFESNPGNPVEFTKLESTEPRVI